MDPAVDKQRELLAHISDLVEKKKVEITDHYATEKLRFPKYLRDITIDHLRGAGATVDVEFVVPQATDDHFRKFSKIKEKMNELRDEHIGQVRKYYEDAKKNIPKCLLDKRVRDLVEEDWERLGIDMVKYKKLLKNVE